MSIFDVQCMVFLNCKQWDRQRSWLKRTVNKATDPLTVMLTEKNEQSENELPVFADFKTKLTMFIFFWGGMNVNKLSKNTFLVSFL